MTQEQTGLRPSEQLGIEYRWVALDLDESCKILGSRVESEFKRRAGELAEAKNPKRPKGSKVQRDYVPVEDWEMQEVWAQTVGKIVDDVIVFFEDGTRSPDNPDPMAGLEYIKTTPIRWRTEKPITGNPVTDRSPGKGARSKFDELGRKRLEADRDGKIIFRWSPG